MKGGLCEDCGGGYVKDCWGGVLCGVCGGGYVKGCGGGFLCGVCKGWGVEGVKCLKGRFENERSLGE